MGFAQIVKGRPWPWTSPLRQVLQAHHHAQLIAHNGDVTGLFRQVAQSLTIEGMIGEESQFITGKN